VATNRELIKRLAAIKQALTGNATELIFVWTRNLASRIEQALAKRGEHRRKYQLVHWPLTDADGSYEAELRASNPKEAAWLDALLEGRTPRGY
jgi:Lhr-like helicase